MILDKLRRINLVMCVALMCRMNTQTLCTLYTQTHTHTRPIVTCDCLVEHRIVRGDYY